MKSIAKLTKVSMLTAMVAVVMVMLPSQSLCPAVDPLDHTVLLPSPESCSDFYSCKDGVAILMHCPDGLYFNDKLDVCDWPQNVACEGNRRWCWNSFSGGIAFPRICGSCKIFPFAFPVGRAYTCVKN